MTLHLSPEERKVYDRERNRQRSALWQERKREKERRREEWYRRLEEQNEALAAQNERLRAGYERIRAAMEDLQNNPPERIVEKTVTEQVQTLMHVGNIAAVMKLCHEAQKSGPHWLKELWGEQEAVMRLCIRCPKCGNEDGPFIK